MRGSRTWKMSGIFVGHRLSEGPLWRSHSFGRGSRRLQFNETPKGLDLPRAVRFNEWQTGRAIPAWSVGRRNTLLFLRRGSFLRTTGGRIIQPHIKPTPPSRGVGAFLRLLTFSCFCMLTLTEETRSAMTCGVLHFHCGERSVWTAAFVLASLFLVGCSGRGERVTFYPNGQVKERWHERTVGPNRVVRDGKYEAFYPDGAKQTMGEYNNGDSLGIWMERYMIGGNKSERTYGESGKLKGRAIVWMPSGDTLEFKTFNDLGELDGRYAAFWRDNGELREQGEYKRGKRHGEWTKWYHNGQMEHGREYDRGRSVGRWVDIGVDGNVASVREFLRAIPAELSEAWGEALVDGVPTGMSSLFQRSDRRVDTIASDERDYGQLQKKGLDWIGSYHSNGALLGLE
jgi:antitoxin component YwqK of YwqJK toxin-antitoxin module